MGNHLHQTTQMKVSHRVVFTLALVAVTNAAPAFMRRGTCATVPDCGAAGSVTTTNIACKCGTVASCAAGKVCKINANQCLPACSVSTAAAAGTAAPTGGCSCGSDGVVVAATKYCGIKTDGTGLEMPTATCPTAKTDGKSSPAAACNCGTNALVPVTTAQFCVVATGVVGAKKDKPVCAGDGSGTTQNTVDGGCLCGSDFVAVADNKWCYIKADGTGVQQDPKQCKAFAAAQGDGTTAAAQNCNCGLTAATAYCDWCFMDGKVATINKGAISDCASTDGTAAHATGPVGCKCGVSACATGKFCLSAAASAANRCRSQTITGVACSNTVGATAVTADCMCGTSLAIIGKFCIQAKNAVNTAALANCAGVDGNTVVAAGVACKCGPATGTRSDDICVAGEFCNGAEAGTGNAGANGKCRTAALTPPSPATPAPPPTTITQKITFSGTQASYTGTLKTFSEQSYGKAIGIFDTTLTTPAYKTGCSVASVASASRRTSYAVTFTATVASAQASAANTASAALTTTSFATAAAAVKAANTAYAAVPAPTATAVAAPSATTPTVSGASAVTTSIMAMAVAVLAAFQARQ